MKTKLNTLLDYFLRIPLLVRALLVFTLLLVSSFLLGRCTAPQSTQDKGGVLTSKVETKTDTLFYPSKPLVIDSIVEKPTLKIVYIDKSNKRPIPLTQSDGTPTLKHRVYSDSVEVVKDLKVGYTAKVSGILDTIDLGIRDTRPTKVIVTTNTITNTLTKTKYPTGLYIGGFSTQQLTNFGPEVQVVRPKFSLGVGYDIKQAAPQLHIGFNLLHKKDR